MVVATQIYLLVLDSFRDYAWKVLPLNKLHGKIPDKVFGWWTTWDLQDPVDSGLD